METIEELFETLDPKQKAAFLDARLEWATSGALCQEVRERLCEPARFEDMPDGQRPRQKFRHKNAGIMDEGKAGRSATEAESP